MDSFRYYTESERQHNFESAHKNLTQIFSKYPFPGELQGCPCCTGNHLVDTSNADAFDSYLGNSINLLGDENDFKHYLPLLLNFVYLDQKSYRSFVLMERLNYIQDWTQEEAQAIDNWFIAYLQFKYINTIENHIKESRTEVQKWLASTKSTENFCSDLPFSIFLEQEYLEEIKPFLHSSVIEDFSNLLDLWPQNELDFIALASRLTTFYLSVVSDCKKIFQSDKLFAWLLNVEKCFEDYFWKTSDPQLQQLFSDALEIMKNAKNRFDFL